MAFTILVTGSAGFVASHCVDHFLKHTDHNIIGLDRLDFSGNLNRLAELESVRKAGKRFRQVFHDLKAAINPLLAKQIGPVDWILHLAAASHVDRSIADPMSFVMDNVVGTCNVLIYAREIGARVYYQSTDEIFGPAFLGNVYREWDCYHSGNVYAATKAGAEELCLAFQNTHKMHIVIGHSMNILGPMQHPEKYLPSTIRKVQNGERVLIHADSTCTKPGSRYYIHANEVARAIEFLMEHGVTGDKYNIVGEREVNNRELAEQIALELRLPLSYKLINFHESRPGHDLAYGLSGFKLEAMGFKRKILFEEAVHQTVKWSLANPHWI